jgi:hypothetical protein
MRRESRWDVVSSRIYFVKNGDKVFKETVVWKAHDTKATGGYNPVTHEVVVRLMSMDCPVNLDNKARIKTKEIRDEAINDLLPPEVQTTATVVTQLLPKAGLRRRHRPPHRSSKFPFDVGFCSEYYTALFHPGFLFLLY